MSLTTAQLQALKTDIAADGTLSALPNTPDNNATIAVAYNLTASPDFYVWRSSVSEAEYTGTAGVDVANGNAATTWSWTAYILRSAGEQNAWGRMFLSGACNPSLDNIRQGVADIFSGSANSAPAQRNHLLVISKRKTTRVEKIFSAGTGSFAVPAKLGFEGSITYQDVTNARNS